MCESKSKILYSIEVGFKTIVQKFCSSVIIELHPYASKLQKMSTIFEREKIHRNMMNLHRKNNTVPGRKEYNTISAVISFRYHANDENESFYPEQHYGTRSINGTGYTK